MKKMTANELATKLAVLSGKDFTCLCLWCLEKAQTDAPARRALAGGTCVLCGHESQATFVVATATHYLNAIDAVAA